MQVIFDIPEICARYGISEAILCPGSRCAPLTISFARHPGIRVRTVSDERSAAFIAAGIALQTATPVVLICTSGTAAANFYPAIAESYYQHIPLVVLTADRPPEWVDQQDGQTIRQNGLFGPHVKRSYSFPVDHKHPDSVWHGNRITCEAINTSKAFPPGPVHINIPLREPFYPEKEIQLSENIRVIKDILPLSLLPAAEKVQLEKDLNSFKKILLVPGQSMPDASTVAAVNHFCSLSGAVLIADSISNYSSVNHAVVYHDTILCGGNGNSDLKPDLLITFGNSVISKGLKTFLRKDPPSEHWHIQPAGEAPDTFQCLSRIIRIKTEQFFSAFTFSGSDNAFLTAWQTQNHQAKIYLNQFFTTVTNFSEMEATYRLLDKLPEKSILHLANSMPVRYVNYCGVKPNITVYSNRGTSGIDGVISTAVGAAVSTDRLVTVLTGDMAFLYDRNAFWHNYMPSNLRIVVLNNHGGGIFRMIDGPSRQPELEDFFVTRQPLSCKAVADEFSLGYSLCTTKNELEDTLSDFFSVSDQAKILEIETDGIKNTDIFNKYKQLSGYGSFHHP